MKILKTALGNTSEAFIEDRLTDGVNIIFSNDNNKGKTIIFQGLMYALGNEPIFPGGFDYRSFYFYTSFEHNGSIFEFLRKNDTITVKIGDSVRYFEDASELKRFVDQKVFPLPRIIKDKLPKMVDLSLFYQIFFIGQDKRDPSNVFTTGYYNKTDFLNMLYSLSNCLTLEDTTAKLSQLRKELAACKAKIETLSKRITFYKDHPEIATKISRSADRQNYEKERKELIAQTEAISKLQRKRDRLTNRIIKLNNLLSELNSLNQQLKCGEIRCMECGSDKISFVSGDFSFELTNDLVRRNIIQSVKDNIHAFGESLDETKTELNKLQAELYRRTTKTDVPVADIFLYSDEIRSCAEDEDKLHNLFIDKDELEEKIAEAEQQENIDAQKQSEIKTTLLASMNQLYKKVDPSGQQYFSELFAKKNVTFSGCDEQEYYFSRTLAIYWLLKHSYPIIMDCFRKGELSTKKENAMIEEYLKTGNQVILSSTLKDEEYVSGSKYYSMENVNALDYEVHPDSHILQPQYVPAFSDLVQSFGITFA